MCAMIKPMRKMLFLTLILAFSGTAVFGFLAMGHNELGRHNGCLAVSIFKFACSLMGQLDLANFHINAFKSFSTAIFILNLVLASLILLFSIAWQILLFNAQKKILVARLEPELNTKIFKITRQLRL